MSRSDRPSLAHEQGFGGSGDETDGEEFPRPLEGTASRPDTGSGRRDDTGRAVAAQVHAKHSWS